MKRFRLYAFPLGAVIAGLVFLVFLIGERAWFLLGFFTGSIALGAGVAALLWRSDGRNPLPLPNEYKRPEISMHRIQVGGGVAGLVFAVGSCLIFLVGIPALRWFLLGAVVAGSAVGGFLWRWHKNRPVEITDIHDANG